jgi:Ca2+-binding EF-hand superfamily protein
MKYAVIALLASVSAIKIEKGKKHRGCITRKMSNGVYGELDTNKNGSLDYGEIKVGLEELAKSQDYTPTKEDWAWVEATGKKIDKKNPGKVSKGEFNRFANAVAKHFDLCHLVEDDHAPENKCVSKELAKDTFKELDTNHNGSLDYKEIEAGLKRLAASQDYTPTKEDIEWVEKVGEKIDAKSPGKVDEKEFWMFSNAVMHHFHICHLAQEAEKDEASLAQAEGVCLTPAETNKGFGLLDTNHNGSLSYDEIEAGIKWIAKKHDYTPTEADWDWVKATGAKIDSKTPGKVNKVEFGLFANAFAKHFDLCPK